MSFQTLSHFFHACFGPLQPLSDLCFEQILHLHHMGLFPGLTLRSFLVYSKTSPSKSVCALMSSVSIRNPMPSLQVCAVCFGRIIEACFIPEWCHTNWSWSPLFPVAAADALFTHYQPVGPTCALLQTLVTFSLTTPPGFHLLLLCSNIGNFLLSNLLHNFVVVVVVEFLAK